MTTFDKPFGDVLKQQLPKRRQEEKDAREAADNGNVKQADPLCSICHGAGAYYWASTRVGPWKQQELQICDCIYGRRNPERQQAILGRSGLEENLHITFEHPTDKHTGPRRGSTDAWRQAVAYCDDPGSCPPWFFMHGEKGQGKTTIALCIGTRHLALARPVIFRTAAELIADLYAGFRRDADVAFDERLAELKDTPLLIVDELGREANTEKSVEVLFDLFHYRWLHRKRTVFTTNCGLRDLHDSYRARISDSTRCALIPVPDEVAR